LRWIFQTSAALMILLRAWLHTADTVSLMPAENDVFDNNGFMTDFFYGAELIFLLE
jgi:hypothetical protein